MRYILFIILLISVNGYSQCKTFMIGVKGDTLNCVDMKGKKQGRWVNELPPLRGEKVMKSKAFISMIKKRGNGNSLHWKATSWQLKITGGEIKMDDACTIIHLASQYVKKAGKQ
jgi:hypothetical protein